MVTADQSHSANSHTENGHHEDRPELQHHFETPEQQFDSSKFGMWLFLATELLLFGGLFCAYVVYRTNHPDIFHYAHQFLDTNMGALNTAVLIFSSLTMAWAVRAAQLNKQIMLITLLSITVLCGIAFMGVKYVEYSSKIKYGLTWGSEFKYDGLQTYLDSHHAHDDDHESDDHDSQIATHGSDTPDHSASEMAAADQTDSAQDEDQPVDDLAEPIEYSQLPTAEIGPTGLIRADSSIPQNVSSNHVDEIPKNVHVFFGIYYCMTGLHAIHVIVGLIAISWLISKAVRGQFSSNYYTPVDLVGLYWHVVDLIWIFLFPLLYLIE